MISTARSTPKTRLDDPSHHLAALSPHDDPDSNSSSPILPPAIALSPACPKPSFVRGPKSSMPKVEDVSVWLRWAIDSASALRVLLLPPLLALPTHFLLPLLHPYLPLPLQDVGNPFTPFFLLSHPTPAPERLSAAVVRPELIPTTQLYLKGPGDLAMLAYNIVLFSFLRLVLSHTLFPALARRWGIRKAGKLARFGEQGYAVVYFLVVGVWGVYTLSTTPVSSTLNPLTAHFWIDYPHNHLSGPMKRYYLSQIAYWLQQALVLILGLEKRRSDYWEFVLHHVITVWMVGWSYLMNVTLLGTAVFISMDLPDMCLAFSKMLNYLQLERAKVVSFGVFVVMWTYFRHYISIRILWSLQYEFHLVPKHAQIFSPRTGLYMATWMRDQMFYTLCILQALNIFWYSLIVRILIRTIMTSQTDDNRSDDEGEEDEEMERLDIDTDTTSEPAEKGLGASIGRDTKTLLDTEKQAPLESKTKTKKGGRSKGKKTSGAGARAGGAHGLSAVPNGGA